MNIFSKEGYIKINYYGKLKIFISYLLGGEHSNQLLSKL